MKEELTYVGIDIAKERVDVAIRPSGRSWSLPYDDTETEELVRQLQEVMPAAVILEATGGIELPLAAALAAASLPVAVVNPRQVRDFAKSTGQLAKTTGWTHGSWPTSARPYALQCGPFGTLILKFSRRYWRAGSR